MTHAVLIGEQALVPDPDHGSVLVLWLPDPFPEAGMPAWLRAPWIELCDGCGGTGIDGGGDGGRHGPCRACLGLGDVLFAFSDDDDQASTVAAVVPPELAGPYVRRFRVELGADPLGWPERTHGGLLASVPLGVVDLLTRSPLPWLAGLAVVCVAVGYAYRRHARRAVPRPVLQDRLAQLALRPRTGHVDAVVPVRDRRRGHR